MPGSGPTFRPVFARVEGKFIHLTLENDGEISLDMPNEDGAAFVATTMQAEFIRARRDGF